MNKRQVEVRMGCLMNKKQASVLDEIIFKSIIDVDYVDNLDNDGYLFIKGSDKSYFMDPQGKIS